MVKVKLAIPKGHLGQDTLKMLSRAGYIISGQERTYRPSINDPEIELKVLRPQEIPTFVAEGMQDVGISGYDWVKETEADVEILLDLEYSRVSIVLAVPKSMSDVEDLSSLLSRFVESDKTLRISTEYLNTASNFIKSNEVYKMHFGDAEPFIVTPWWRRGDNDQVAIYLSFGATEAKPPEDADAIIEVVDTGTSLDQNNLVCVEKLMETSALFFANKKAMSDPEKLVKIKDIMTLLTGVVDGVKKLHIFANVEKKNLDRLLEELPALKRPTISSLSDPEWVAINTVIDKDRFLQILPKLRELAQGLVVYEPRQVLPLEEIASEDDVQC
ncbi:MAG: ATP phosphoribosyltransferase [Candidatus Bathyarchaeia archaeon]